MKNSWDKLSERYNTYNKGAANFYAADNVFIAWPALFEGIEAVQPSGVRRTALDFGCGTGAFGCELQSRKYRAVGCDTSAQMVALARKHYGNHVRFHIAGHERAAAFDEAPFDLVSAVMVFQFVRDIESVLDSLDKALKPGGVIAFAVFNPAHIRLNCGGHPFLKRASSGQDGTDVFMSLGDAGHIPVYVRDERDYGRLFKARHYSKILVRKPRFTRAFLDKYPADVDTSCSEYIVMVYRKDNGDKALPIKKENRLPR